MTSGKKAVFTVYDERYYADEMKVLWLQNHEPDIKEPKEEN